MLPGLQCGLLFLVCGDVSPLGPETSHGVVLILQGTSAWHPCSQGPDRTALEAWLSRGSQEGWRSALSPQCHLSLARFLPVSAPHRHAVERELPMHFKLIGSRQSTAGVQQDVIELRDKQRRGE